MQVLYMHCGGSKGAAVIVPVSAGASHSVPVKSTWLMQSGTERSCQMTINLQWKIFVEKIEWVKAVNQLNMHSVVALWRAGQCVKLCQILSHWSCSVGAGESSWLSSALSRECFVESWATSVLLCWEVTLHSVLSSECSWRIGQANFCHQLLQVCLLCCWLAGRAHHWSRVNDYWYTAGWHILHIRVESSLTDLDVPTDVLFI